MCELCETITNEKLVNGRSIAKLEDGTYELRLWDCPNEFDSTYTIFLTTPIKCCLECGERLEDK